MPPSDLTYYSTGTLFDIAKEAYKRSISGDHPKGYNNDALVAIVFATSTLEAFMSNAVDLAKVCSSQHPKIEIFANLLGELDSKEVATSLKMKYYIAHWIICEKKSDRGAEPYQSFDLLVDLRNALIHLKPDEVTSKKINNLLLQLKNKGLISNFDHNSLRATWIIYISNAQVAKWACNTAASMIKEFWKSAPEEEVRHFFCAYANAPHYTVLD